MSDTQSGYFIRWKGVVTGPFPMDKILNDLKDGQLSLMHQVQTPNGWVPLQKIIEEEEEKRKKAAQLEAEKLRQSQKLEAERAKQQAKPTIQAPAQLAKPSLPPLPGVSGPSSDERLNKLRNSLPPPPPTYGMPGGVSQGYGNPTPPPPPPGRFPSTFPQGFQNQAFQQQSQPKVVVRPPANMASAILATLFCCLPFGIVAIVYAAQVDSKFNAGDYDGANQASRSASTWCNIAVLSGILVGIFWAVAQANH